MAQSIAAIVTAYNSDRFIGEAVASIRAQTRPPDEIIVMDDGSTDRTGEIVAGLGRDIRYVRQENRGEAAARNRAIAQTTSDFIAFLDADDAWPPERTTHLLDHVRDAGPEVDIVCGRSRYFRDEPWEAALLPGVARPEVTTLVFSCALIRRTAFERVGAVNETIRIGSDFDWFLRAIEVGILPRLANQVALLYRRHGGNLTADFRDVKAALAMVLKRSLDRRRQRGAALPLPAWVSAALSR